MTADSGPVVVRTRDALARARADLAGASERLALVPTMGALHQGHLSLIRRAGALADRVAISIYVNPTQFGPGEDLETYPRDLERDVGIAGDAGVDLVFAPESDAVVYPDGAPRITVDPGALADRLCGARRPGHFRGVLTVVAKLFGLVRPHVAVFGRKDFQQSVLIRRMVEDLELDVRIETGPIVREDDGLAVSSRNAYLSDEERRDAVGLYRGLSAALASYREGTRSVADLRRAVRSEVESRKRLELEYVSLVDPDDLEPVDPADEGAVLAGAVRCGEARLIDNVVLGRS